MEAYYILIISFLFLLAISLLIVGVSNDAVNFLNSAIGSKAASFKVILAIAAVGILVGAVFSNGMMEVARKGIFNPQHFYYSEIIIIFFAVMLANILLLDFFNTYGLPTSTTVSIVFGLLGAAVAVSIFKVARAGTGSDSIDTYINLKSSVMIILGIFLSVVVAFTFGTIIQWFVRLFFSFRLEKTYKIWAGIWSGFAITAILYFLVMKGAQGSALITPNILEYTSENTTRILLISFVGWTLIFQLLVMFTRINILKITVLTGTFALAMAFAGNDLVNFIGVPLAGFESFKAFAASGSADAGTFAMDILLEPVKTPVYFLVISGLIMVLALRFSKKARSVTETTIDLSRQDEGAERFESSSPARFIVRLSVETANGIDRITPKAVKSFVNKRFSMEAPPGEQKNQEAFDLVRASVNLVVASILIAIGTAHKLPLSTTYVTFMVAMGTSLSDGAWGRDSAVYRVSGVLTVIGGWFFTAFSAFVIAFILATVTYFGRLPVMFALMALSAFILFRTHLLHKKRNGKTANPTETKAEAAFEILKKSDDKVRKYIGETEKILLGTYSSFLKEKHKELKKLKKDAAELSKDIRKEMEEMPATLKRFRDADLVPGHHYVQVLAYLKEMSNSINHVVYPAFNHVDNNHAFDRDQNEKMKEFAAELEKFFDYILDLLKNKKYDEVDDMVEYRNRLIQASNDILLQRIRILKRNKKGVKISVTYIEMLTETRNLLLSVSHVVKSELRLIDSVVSGVTVLEEEVQDE